MGFVGIDGCAGGWLSIALGKGGGWQVAIDRSFREVWDRWEGAESVLVDIPIGLPDEGAERDCDKVARKVIGARRSSVFPVPCREALAASSYTAASELNHTRTGRRLSKQTWAILDKIREVDQLLSVERAARSVVREIHPEVLFWALNGGEPMAHPKRTPAGQQERIGVLARHYLQTAEVVEYAKRVFNRTLLARDDVLDSLAAAVTAWLGRDGASTLPADPSYDSAGLPMEMVYCMV